jgi:hypothetical protein
MPWTKLNEEQTFNAYKEIFLETQKCADKDDNLTVKSFMIRAELLKHDFTKRQMIIVMFIFTFSYLYGKEWALIPKLQDFEICGISKTKVKFELKKLIDMQVIEWKQEENLFGIKDPQLWLAEYNSGYNDMRSKELFLLNLRHAEVDVTGIIEKYKQ